MVPFLRKKACQSCIFYDMNLRRSLEEKNNHLGVQVPSL